MIKIDSIEPGTKFCTTAVVSVKNGEKIYRHIGVSREHSYMWGDKPEDIIDIECEIVDNDLSINELMTDESYDNNCIDYFCHAEIQEDCFDISMIYPNIKQFFMCYPYGPDASRFWSHEIKNIHGDIEHRPGDRRAYQMRLKVREVNPGGFI